MNWVLLVLVSIVAASAQIMMKLAAEHSVQIGRIFEFKVLSIVVASFVLSCVGQAIWFVVLRSNPLSTSYLFLSLVFVLVPVAGLTLFSEALRPLHFVSMTLIFLGVMLLGFTR